MNEHCDICGYPQEGRPIVQSLIDEGAWAHADCLDSDEAA